MSRVPGDSRIVSRMWRARVVWTRSVLLHGRSRCSIIGSRASIGISMRDGRVFIPRRGTWNLTVRGLRSRIAGGVRRISPLRRMRDRIVCRIRTRGGLLVGPFRIGISGIVRSLLSRPFGIGGIRIARPRCRDVDWCVVRCHYARSAKGSRPGRCGYRRLALVHRGKLRAFGASCFLMLGLH